MFLLSCLILAFGVIVAVAYRRRWEWTGFTRRSGGAADAANSPKTLWNWLELLLVPAGIAIALFALNNAQSGREQRRADRRAAVDRSIAAERIRADILHTYLQQMSNLLLDRGLLKADWNGPLVNFAQTLTLTVFHQLDGRRKGEVLQFLANTGLIKPPRPKIDLTRADLRHVDAHERSFSALDVENADLRGADFRRAAIYDSSFSFADLERDDFSFALLQGVTMDGANLARADFRYSWVSPASFEVACLASVTFSHAKIEGSSFQGAIGDRVDFTRAGLHHVDFRRDREVDAPTALTHLRLEGVVLDGTALPAPWEPRRQPSSSARNGAQCGPEYNTKSRSRAP